MGETGPPYSDSALTTKCKCQLKKSRIVTNQLVQCQSCAHCINVLSTRVLTESLEHDNYWSLRKHQVQRSVLVSLVWTQQNL